MYEFTGRIKRIGEVMTFANNFTKRELVVEQGSGGEWPNVVCFTFKRANCEQLNRLTVGEEVKLGFVIDGREWNDTKNNKIRCFNDLTALKLEVVRSGNSASAANSSASASAPGSSSDDESDIPF